MAKYVYEYVWDITFSIPDRNISFKPYALIDFTKTCNYFTDFIPSYSMICKIEEKYLNILKVFDKELTVFIKLYMYYGANRGVYSDKELISEQEFAVYYDKDQIPAYMKSVKTVSLELDSADKINVSDAPGSLSQHEIKFQLLLKNDLKMKTYLHNYILGGDDTPVDPMTAVMTIIDQNPYIKKCIVDQPANTNAYPNMIIEASELKDAIKNVQFNYGIYDKGLLLFYDDEVLYVLNKCNLQHSYTKDDINLVQLLIDERTDVPVVPEHVTINKKEGFIGYERMSKIFKEDYESIEGIATGNKFVYSNYESVINSGFGNKGETTFFSPLKSVDKPRPSRVDVGAKIIVDYDMLNNPYNMSSTMYEKSIGVPITVGLQNVNLTHFRANKIIKVNMDTPESKKLYAGLYNIQSAIFYFKTLNNPSKRYSTYGHVLLKLCNKQEGFDKDYSPAASE